MNALIHIAMKLEEEVALYQFCQGVYSIGDMLDRFEKLEKVEQREQFFTLYCDVWDPALQDEEIEAALEKASLTNPEEIYKYLHFDRLKSKLQGGISIPSTDEPPSDGLNKAYYVLLELFRMAYQRHFTEQNANLSHWKYSDLTTNDAAERIIKRHYELVDEVYALPEFHNEFYHLTKLWHEHNASLQTRAQGQTHELDSSFQFITYVDMLGTTFLENKRTISIKALRSALGNALTLRYGLDAEQGTRLVLAVIERNLQETYHERLF